MFIVACNFLCFSTPSVFVNYFSSSKVFKPDASWQYIILSLKIYLRYMHYSPTFAKNYKWKNY
jgi:hypothetical protein